MHLSELFSLFKSSSENPEIPAPDLWFKTIIYCFVIILFLFSCFNLIYYIFEKSFRQVLGSLTFFYSLSALCLSALWTNIFDSPVSENCQIPLAFFTLLVLFSCIFYQISFTVYFLCYFKDRKMANASVLILQIMNGLENDEPIKADPGQLQEDLDIEGAYIQPDEFPPLLEKYTERHNKVVKACKSYRDENAKLKANEKINHQKLLNLERSIREDRNNSHSHKLLSMNSKINACVFIASFSLTMMAALQQALGNGYFGDWSISWKPEVQNDGVIFYLIIGAVNLLMTVFALIYFYGNPENYQGRLEKLNKKGRLTPEERQERHYLTYICPFIIVMTILSCMFLATHIYASQKITNISERWTYGSWKVLAIFRFGSPVFQVVLLFVLKITEPGDDKEEEEQKRKSNTHMSLVSNSSL